MDDDASFCLQPVEGPPSSSSSSITNTDCHRYQQHQPHQHQLANNILTAFFHSQSPQNYRTAGATTSTATNADGSVSSNAFLYRSSNAATATTTSTSPSSSSSSTATFSTSTYFPKSRHHVYSSPRKLQIDLNPRYVSRFSNAPRTSYKHHAQQHASSSSSSSSTSTSSTAISHRMRPYYVPERSRTKSENAIDLVLANVTQLLPELNGADTTLEDEEDNDDDDEDKSSDSICYHNNNRNDGQQQQQQQHNMMDTTTAMMDTTSVQHRDATAAAAASPTATQQPPAIAVPGLKKARSLEDVCRGARSADVGSQPSHEMEFMSSRIQKLKVHD